MLTNIDFMTTTESLTLPELEWRNELRPIEMISIFNLLYQYLQPFGEISLNSVVIFNLLPHVAPWRAQLWRNFGSNVRDYLYFDAHISTGRGSYFQPFDQSCATPPDCRGQPEGRVSLDR